MTDWTLKAIYFPSGYVVYYILLITLFLSTYVFPAFFNDGTMSGWDGNFTENKGTVNEVTDVAYSGKTSLKFSQVCN